MLSLEVFDLALLHFWNRFHSVDLIHSSWLFVSRKLKTLSKLMIYRFGIFFQSLLNWDDFLKRTKIKSIYLKHFGTIYHMIWNRRNRMLSASSNSSYDKIIWQNDVLLKWMSCGISWFFPIHIRYNTRFLSNLYTTDKRIKWECQACSTFICVYWTYVRANRISQLLSVKAHLHAWSKES